MAANGGGDSCEEGNGTATIATTRDDRADPAPPPSAPSAPPQASSRIQKLLGEEIWKEESETVEYVLNELDGLTFIYEGKNSTAMCTEIDSVGGAAILVGVMEKWQAYSRIQNALFQLLQNIIANNAAFQESLMGAGGLDVVAKTMERFPFLQDLQSNACSFWGYTTSSKPYADHFVNKLEGHLLVITAMNRFPYASYLQDSATWVLCNLSEWDEFKAPIVKAGGDHALVNAIKNIACNDESEVHEQARLALLRLNRCLGCHKTLKKAMYCSRCNKATYCSKECQRKDWKLHKHTECE